MTEKKITKRDYFEAILKNLDVTGFSTELISNEKFIKMTNHELELLDRKRTGGSKSKASIENEKCAEWVINYLASKPNLVVTGSDLMKVIPIEMIAKGEISQSKMTAIMSVVCGTWEHPKADSPINRFKDKRKTFYQFKKIEEEA